jgi:hypothetical protein
MLQNTFRIGSLEMNGTKGKDVNVVLVVAFVQCLRLLTEKSNLSREPQIVELYSGHVSWEEQDCVCSGHICNSLLMSTS